MSVWSVRTEGNTFGCASAPAEPTEVTPHLPFCAPSWEPPLYLGEGGELWLLGFRITCSLLARSACSFPLANSRCVPVSHV